VRLVLLIARTGQNKKPHAVKREAVVRSIESPNKNQSEAQARGFEEPSESLCIRWKPKTETSFWIDSRALAKSANSRDDASRRA
jgi:hypothetical protein